MLICCVILCAAAEVEWAAMQGELLQAAQHCRAVVNILVYLCCVHKQVQRAEAERAALQEELLQAAQRKATAASLSLLSSRQQCLFVHMQLRRAEAERAAMQEELLQAAQREAAAQRAAQAAPRLEQELQVGTLACEY